MATKFYGGLVDIETPDVTIGGIRNMGFNPGVQRVLEGAGALDPTDQFVMNVMSQLTFATCELSVLGSIGLAGADLTNLTFYLQSGKGSSGRELYSAAKHIKGTIATGFAVPTQLTASRDQVAELSYQVMALSSDGSTASVSLAANQTMPAQGDPSERFTIGPVTLNGDTIEVETVSVEFGINAAVRTNGGQMYPTLVEIPGRQPTITLTGPHVAELVNAGLVGEQQGATDSVIAFRKVSTSARVADDTGEHVTISIDEGVIQPTNVSFGGPGEAADIGLQITPTWDGTAAILAIAVDATL